jgi:pectin methylesterase-like acyl-CoA thioesterase
MKSLNYVIATLSTLTISAALGSLTLAFQDAEVAAPNLFTANTPAVATEVNENFQVLADAINFNESRIAANEADLDSIPRPDRVITVASSGGDFTSVSRALESIDDNSERNRYLVMVAPGEYDESELCLVKSFVHLMGAGSGVTVIRRPADAQDQNSAGRVVQVQDQGTVSDMTILNESGLDNVCVGVFASNTSASTTLVQNLVIIVNGPGGQTHLAVHVVAGDLTIRDCFMHSEGATFVNVGLKINSDKTTTSLVERTTMEAEPNSNTIFDFAADVQLTNVDFHDCIFRGSAGGLAAPDEGTIRVFHSRVETDATANSVQVGLNTFVFFAGTHFDGGRGVGPTGSIKYVHCSKNDFDPVIDGFNSRID